MLALTKIKKDIEFNARFRTILSVLKSVAVSQFIILEKRLTTFKEFDELLKEFFSLLGSIKLNHPFFDPADRPTLVVSITSDHGMLGGLNARVTKVSLTRLRPGRDQWVIVGEQGKNLAAHSGISFESFPGVQDENREKQARELGKHLFGRVMKENFGAVEVVYPHALSLVNHRVETAAFIPLEKGTLAPPSIQAPDAPAGHIPEIIFESTPEKLLEYLVYLSFGHKLAYIFSLARLAEVAARYTHLEESAQKIDDLNKKLKLRYFRLRHEVIDASMRELFTARLIDAG